MWLTLTEVTPFLPNQLSGTNERRAKAWLSAMEVKITARYGSHIDVDLQPIFLGYCADAIERRLYRPSGMIDAQTTGPFSVKYNARATLGGWFLPEEIADMDSVTGKGGMRTMRTPAPDGVRFGNLARRHDDGEPSWRL